MADNGEVRGALARLVRESGGTWTPSCDRLADEFLETLTWAVLNRLIDKSGKNPLHIREQLALSIKHIINRP